MILHLKNFQLSTIGKALNYSMPFQKGRIRMKFLKLLGDKQKLVDDSRVEMLKELADKDDKKVPIIEKGAYKLSPENLTKMNTEYEKLMNEECLVDIPESMKMDIGPLKNLLLESTTPLDARETSIVEEVYEALTVAIKEKTEKEIKKVTDKKKDGDK